MGASLDTSFLPPAELAFVVMTDTHYMLDPGPQKIEFESRRRQAGRAAHALAKIATLETAFVVHLGDLVQEFPEGPGFAEALAQALQQFADAGVAPRQVAGNHDVGDKADPTMPTDWVSEATLEAYHQRFGPSWTSWNAAGCHFVILNSQIMNGQLPAASEQVAWLEADLDAHGEMPTFIFQHLMPFLVDEREPGLGHYDNVDEPARSWLLGLIRKHNVQMIFAGHSHFAFFNRIGNARSYLVPSTAFTRPGFCEVFSSAPPPERGRDDAPKLGFFLVRLHDRQARVHFVRTGGAIADPAGASGSRQLVTCVTGDLPHSPLGLTLRHPLTVATEVPIAWQSTVRQPVRNDFPLLACLEAGVRHLRVPAQDLANAAQRERLAVLRDEGVAITATWIWSTRSPLVAEATHHRDLLDGVEIQLPNALVPDDTCLAAIAEVRRELSLPVSLAPLLPHEHVPGKQHARTRIGYHQDELAALDQRLREAGTRVDRVLCRVDAAEHPADAMPIQGDVASLTRIGAIDWAVEFAEGDRAPQTSRATSALAIVASQPGARLYLEPFIDLDRTMDAPPGLLDRLCNPNPVFHALRTLNSVLFGQPGAWAASTAPALPDARTLSLERAGTRLLLVLPAESRGEPATDAPGPDPRDWPGTPAGNVRLIALEEGRIGELAASAGKRQALPRVPLVLLAGDGPPA
jgi:hypothetical protein